MVQRQRNHHHLLTIDQVASDPGADLLQVGDQVGVRQHHAFGHAGGATGVLQEGDVVALDRDLGQRQMLAFAQRGVELGRARDVPCRHHLLDVLHDTVDDQLFEDRQHVADFGRDHVQLALRLALHHCLQRVREVLQHDDGHRARILQLVLKLTRRVLRVGVDDHEAGAQGAEQRHRVLQQVRQHQGDAVAALQAQLVLQKRTERAAGLVEFGIAQGHAHVAERRQVSETRATALEDILQRFKGMEIDLGRNARRVMSEPDLVESCHRLPFASTPLHVTDAATFSAAAPPTGLTCIKPSHRASSGLNTPDLPNMPYCGGG